ncbi:hypothetical protein FY133_01100 [Agrobacterium tumefaciens]|uniref:HIRAN domain-containing protein n=1 Tax=Agrobacterium tumefaciens TaxID=358 RepID=UPI0021D1F603|nr:HIRAN domain-containing protein [Agrobacterium tumefaciens]UXS08209.1 hypothetical protein FY155_00795 [Agrobacterium tumefaciens]UXS15572.1 hypothetical protein FY154_00795 [Agrobacterium tumefaciens]UXT64241.1 hypothetical protein FY133_01100 [Agrobacterium tumefaciens]
MSHDFFLNWQDPEDRKWHPVAKLSRYQGSYIFAYTRGALVSKNFLPFGNMSDLNSVYVSPELFPIFANRVMNERRPEFHRYAEWSGLADERNIDPILLMARMGGIRATDSLQVYSVPEPEIDGTYRTFFFSHGLRYMPEGAQVRTLHLLEGEQLYPMFDIQNPHDADAVALRTSDPATIVGYCPRYLAKDVGKLASRIDNQLKIVIKRVNHDAPAQFRLLCEVTSRWPRDFRPCDDEDHTTIARFEREGLMRAVATQYRKSGMQANLW